MEKERLVIQHHLLAPSGRGPRDGASSIAPTAPHPAALRPPSPRGRHPSEGRHTSTVSNRTPPPSRLTPTHLPLHAGRQRLAGSLPGIRAGGGMPPPLQRHAERFPTNAKNSRRWRESIYGPCSAGHTGKKLLLNQTPSRNRSVPGRAGGRGTWQRASRFQRY